MTLELRVADIQMLIDKLEHVMLSKQLEYVMLSDKLEYVMLSDKLEYVMLSKTPKRAKFYISR